MYLENHAKALINYYSSSDEDSNEDYKKKVKQYRNDINETDEYVLKLKQDNLNNKQTITELLDELEVYQKRIILLKQELLDQKKLAQDSQDQLKRFKVKKQQDRTLQEQKKFQEQFALQRNDALENLRYHFDSTLQQLTPKPSNR
ncbi:unnamed protein product [Paramecium pentaurelia]|uniref:Uncharacterized protein n=1 Tax=Paramecium pentaurelia TaxID=43138 RepID=A0A8S1WBH6_9CILI|nr:unnamed protein product [Paramecium pentaurelia]